MGRRQRVWIVVLLAAVVVVVVGWRLTRGGDQDPRWRTEAVQRGDVRVQVSATGNLRAVTTVLVGTQVSGTVASLQADFNDHVREGQVLAQIDPTFLRAQLAQSVADLERAEVQLRQAERDSARVFPLGDAGLAPRADLDAVQAAVDATRAGVASARAAVDRARTNLRYATIRSPIDGIVISRSVDVGQTVAASLAAPTLFTIAADLTQMQLDAAVDEADIGVVREEQPAAFTVDAYPERRFRGRVHQIRLAPEMIQNVVTYTVVIYVDNPDLRLLPGMTANVTIIVDEASDVLRVPAAALRFRPPQADGHAGGQAMNEAGQGARGDGQRDGGAGQRTMGAGGRGGGAGERTMGAGGRGGSAGEGAMGAGGRGGGAGEGAMGTGDGADLADTGARARPTGVVHVLDGNGRPRPLEVRLGLTDGTFTEVVSDSLDEGDPVVVGTELAASRSRNQGAVNPFAPQMPGRGTRRM